MGRYELSGGVFVRVRVLFMCMCCVFIQYIYVIVLVILKCNKVLPGFLLFVSLFEI